MVQSQLASAPDSGVLLSDEALDGSGSGSSPIGRKKNGYYPNGGKDQNCPDCEDDDSSVDDHDDEEASGSGAGSVPISKIYGFLILFRVFCYFLFFNLPRHTGSF